MRTKPCSVPSPSDVVPRSVWMYQRKNLQGPDHGVGAVFEVFLRIFVVGVGNFDRLSNHVFRKATGIYKALTAVFRHTSGSEHRLVDVICQHMCTVNALFVVVLPDEIGIHTACGGNHTVGFLHGGNVIRIKADGG